MTSYKFIMLLSLSLKELGILVFDLQDLEINLFELASNPEFDYLFQNIKSVMDAEYPKIDLKSIIDEYKNDNLFQQVEDDIYIVTVNDNQELSDNDLENLEVFKKLISYYKAIIHDLGYVRK